MANITIKTNDGKTYEYIHANGLTFPSFFASTIPKIGLRAQIQRVRQMDIRHQDIYMATFPKSGTHWAWEIVQMLRRGSSEYDPESKETYFLDMRPIEAIDALPSPRLLNCHFPAQLIPWQLLEKGNKIVHLQRNLKDVAVSMFHHLAALRTKLNVEQIPFSDFFPQLIGTHGIHLFSNWCKYVKDWERLQKKRPDQIMTLTFEDLKEDPVREIRKLNSFLGFNRSDDLLAEIADACSFNKLKKADAGIKKAHKIAHFKDGDFMYRKGEVGDWKNWFTVAQNEMMDAWLEENLVDTELSFRYEL